MILDDPLAHSFIAPRARGGGAAVVREDYERTWDEDEELGLHDIRTEGYEDGEGGAGVGQDREDAMGGWKGRGEDHPTVYAKGCDDGGRE